MAQKTQIEISLEDTGLWHIDGVSGKWMCVVKIKRDANEFAHVPTHEFCENYVDKMLEAEWRNDNFVFEKGVFGENSKRPPQLLAKIATIQNILDKWKNNTNQDPQTLEEFM